MIVKFSFKSLVFLTQVLHSSQVLAIIFRACQQLLFPDEKKKRHILCYVYNMSAKLALKCKSKRKKIVGAKITQCSRWKRLQKLSGRSDHFLELNSATFYYIYRPSSHIKCPLYFAHELIIKFLSTSQRLEE